MDNDQDAKKGWLAANLENWEFRRLYERELVAEGFITHIESVMAEQKITKTELARRMECSLANVSRAMRKTTNMTIGTMVDMALSLNLRVDVGLQGLALADRPFPPAVQAAAEWKPTIVRTEVPCSDGLFVASVKSAMKMLETEAEGRCASVSWALPSHRSAHETEAHSEFCHQC